MQLKAMGNDKEEEEATRDERSIFWDAFSFIFFTFREQLVNATVMKLQGNATPWQLNRA